MARTKVEEIIMENWKDGLKWFATESKELENGTIIPKLAQNNPKRVVIALVREVIGPFINRSEDPEETIYVTLSDGRQVIEVPARKMKSKEKLLGLRMCRAFGVIDPGYEYNAIKNKEMLKNPNSVIFGDTVVESDQAMLPARVRYSSSYSIRERTELTQKFTHNALSEMGTMWDREKGEHRTSLFSTEYVKPGTLFPSFIVLDNPTPEMLMHMLICLRETTYGAQTSITGPNMKNHIVAIMGCKNEPPVTSYTITESLSGEKEVSLDLLRETMLNELKKYGGEILEGEALKSLVDKLREPGELVLDEAYRQLQREAEDIYIYAGFEKKNEKKKGRKKKEE